MILQVQEKPSQCINPLLRNTDYSFNADLDFCIKPPLLTWIGGLQSVMKQHKLTSTVPNDDSTRKLLTSVSRQLQLINTHFRHDLFKYKYPRVTRNNVLLDSTSHRRQTSYSVILKAIRFQPIERRLPCYGNLELPLKMKHERDLSPMFPPIRTGEHKLVELKMDTETKVKIERSEKDRDKGRDKESR